MSDDKIKLMARGELPSNPTTLGDIWIGNTRPVFTTSCVDYGHVACVRMIAEAREDSDQMARAEMHFGRADIGWPECGHDEWMCPCFAANKEMRVLSEAATARTRGNLRVMADQLEAACMRITELEGDVASGDERLAGVLDGTFSVGDGTAQQEIERLRAELTSARSEAEQLHTLVEALRFATDERLALTGEVERLQNLNAALAKQSREQDAVMADRIETLESMSQPSTTRRPEPPTLDEVRRCQWWWNFRPDTAPQVLRLDVDDDGVIVDVDSSGSYPFEPADWPGDWAPCLPP